MQLFVLPGSGFCPGVRRATAAIEKSLSAEDGRRICVLGELIHNRVYMKQLASRGVETVTDDDLENIAAESSEDRPAELFVRAHGTTGAIEKKLCDLENRYPFFHVKNMTCEYVKRIHGIAAARPKDSLLLIHGAKGHPEVEGILGHASCEAYAFSDYSEAKKIISAGDAENRLITFAVQTTQKTSEWKKVEENAKKDYTNIEIFDTICGVTENRQAEMRSLVDKVAGAVVIGGKTSSNTAKLYDIARSRLQFTQWVESADDLDISIFAGLSSVGIAAGASTPDCIIQEVIDKMENIVEQENFEEMLEASLKIINSGDMVDCTVTSVTSAELRCDIGCKTTGVIAKDQITDDPQAKLEDMFKPGDTFTAFVIKVSDIDGIATLSKKRADQINNFSKIAAAAEDRTVLEGKIVDAVKGGVIAVVDSVRVFIPARNTMLRRNDDLSTLVGTVQKFIITDVNEERKRLYGSIRAVAEAEKAEKEAAVWDSIEEGKHYVGKVKSLTNFGAFVDLGGVDGMVHRSELSWKRIKSPASVVSVGDEIEVFVKSFDKEAHRISLGYKTPEMDNWLVFVAQNKVGDVIPVKIVSILPFGAFAEILDGVDGLIHVSQCSYDKIADPSEVLKVGDIVNVKITAINEEKRKVSLSIRALLSKPEVSDVEPAAETDEIQAEESAAEPVAEVVETPAEEAAETKTEE